ncbi:MAG: hypothetical protein ACOCZ8_03785, partial [Bacteroidota bacterium]
MKTTQELKDYFHNELADDVSKVERKRRLVVMQLIGVSILIAAGIVTTVILHLQFTEIIDAGWLILGIMLSIILGGVMMYEVSRNRGFYYKFKNLIIDRIITCIDPSFVYKSHKFIPVNRFVESHLFQALPTKKYRGDDYVRGRIGDTAVEFSELVAPYRN